MNISEAVLAEFAVLADGPLPDNTDQQFDACVAKLSEQDLVEALDMFDRLVNINVKEPEDENPELNPLRVEEAAMQTDGTPLPVLLPAEVPSGLECSVCGQQSRLAGRLPCSNSPVCPQCCSRQDRCWECGQPPHTLQWPSTRQDGEDDMDRATAEKQEAKETVGIFYIDESGILEVETPSAVPIPYSQQAEGRSPVCQQYKLGQNILAKYSAPDIQQPVGEEVEQKSEEEVGQVERKLAEELQLEPVQFNSFMYWREPIAHVENIVETEWEAATGRVSFEKVNYVENVVKTSEEKMEGEVEIELNVESVMNSDQMSKTVQFNSFMYWREPIAYIEVTEETEMEVGSGSLLTEKEPLSEYSTPVTTPSALARVGKSKSSLLQPVQRKLNYESQISTEPERVRTESESSSATSLARRGSPPSLQCQLCGLLCRKAARLSCSNNPVCWNCAVKKITICHHCWECGESSITTELHLVQDFELRGIIKAVKAGEKESRINSEESKVQPEGSGLGQEASLWRRYCKGQKVLAKYSEDGKWYNGVVLQMFPDGSVDIEYTHYGNCETVLPADIVVDVTELPPDSKLASHVTAQAEGQGDTTPWLEVTEETEMEVGLGSLLTEKVNNVENVVRISQKEMEEKVEIEVKELKSEEISKTEKLRSRVQYVLVFDHGYLFHPSEEGRRLFFHSSQVIGGESLQPGDEVEFELWTGGREQEARSVRKLDSAQRPTRLLSQLKIRNNEELKNGGTRLLLRHQPKGPDGTKGFKIRQHTEVTRSDKVSDNTLGRAKNEGKYEDIKRIPVTRLKLDDVMRLQFRGEEVRGDKYYIWLAKFLQSAYIEGIEEVDDELFLTFKSTQHLKSLLRKYCEKPPATCTELRQLPVRAGFTLVQRCEYGLIVDVEENQNMPIKDVEQTLREVTENVKIRKQSSAFEAYFTELKNFLKILMHKDLSRFHSMTIMRESLVSMKECNGVKFCSGQPCFTERQLLQSSPDEVTAGSLSKFLKQQKAVDEVRLDWNGEVIVTYKNQSMKTMPSLPSSTKSSSMRFCASSSNQKYGVECLGDVDYRDFFQIDDNCVVHKEGAATVLCSPSRRFPFQCLTSRSLKALPCYSSLRLWRRNLVS